MDGAFWFNVAMRWLHVTAAVAGVGATLFVRLALLPALRRLPDGEAVLEHLRPGLKRLIHAALGTALVTGFYNYIAVATPKAQAVREAAGESAARLAAYHPVMGVKMILSLALLGIAAALLAPVPAFHAKRERWLTVNTIIGLLILLLAAFLRRLWP